MKRLIVSDLRSAFKADYELRGKLSPQNASHLKRLETDFGHYRACDLKPEKVDKYIQERLEAGDAPASINRVLQLPGQAFELAVRRGTLARKRYIRKLSEKGNDRSVFFSEKELADVLQNLPNNGLRDFAEWDSLMGQRKSEAAGLTWNMIDGNEPCIPGELYENGRGRVIPLGPELSAIIARRRKVARVEIGGVVEFNQYIFSRRGGSAQIGDFKKAWKTATRLANCPGKLFHDLRRTCSRNLLAAGVPQQIAKQITGHKTDSMFERYAITDSAQVLAAQAKVAEFRKVVAMR